MSTMRGRLAMHYASFAAAVVKMSRTIEDLNAWWLDSATDREKAEVLPGTDAYALIVDACKARKQYLMNGGDPWKLN